MADADLGNGRRLRWHVGMTKPQHLTDALAALNLVLTADELAAVNQPYRPRQHLNSLWG